MEKLPGGLSARFADRAGFCEQFGLASAAHALRHLERVVARIGIAAAMAEAEIFKFQWLVGWSARCRFDRRPLVMAADEIEADRAPAPATIVAVARAELRDAPLLFPLPLECPRGHIFGDDRPAHIREIADQTD